MIPEYADDLDFENRLPVGQAPIMTTSVKRFHAFMQFLMQSRAETGYATMGVITGDAGLGKTIALQTYIQSLTPRAYSGFPACVSIKVSPNSSANAVTIPIVLPLLEAKPCRKCLSPRSMQRDKEHALPLTWQQSLAASSIWKLVLAGSLSICCILIRTCQLISSRFLSWQIACNHFWKHTFDKGYWKHTNDIAAKVWV